MNTRNLTVSVLALAALGLAGCADFARSGAPRRIEGLSGAAHTPAETRTPDDGETQTRIVLTDDATLGDYLQYAALNSPALEAAFNRFKAAVERVPQVSALPDPRFTYQYFIREVETRVGPQRQAFGLSQTFPWFGKLQLRGDAAALAAQAEHQRYQAARLDLFYRVKDAWYEYYYLRQAIRITRENLRLLENVESVARTRYKTAAAEHPDVIRAQVELGKLSDRLASLRDLREPIAARLNAALNRPTGAEIPWPDGVPEAPPSFENDDDVLASLGESNPQLKAMDFEIARAERRIDLARKQYFPDVTLGVNYIDTGESIGGRHPDDDGKDPVIANVSINLPIWWDKLSAGVREARRRRTAAAMDRTDRENMLAAELKMALYEYRDAARKINLYRDTLLPKARESLTSSIQAFRGGRGSFTDMIDAERVYLDFELAYQRALANRAQRLAEIEKLIGEDVVPVATQLREDAAETETNPAGQPTPAG